MTDSGSGLELPVVDELHELVNSQKWDKLLALREKVPLEERSRILWAWPTEDCVEFIKNELSVRGINRILSVGCGSGLLERIIQDVGGLCVDGIELDQSWWQSRYAPKPFIPLNFTPTEMSSNFLLTCTSNATHPWRFALLFCYFNNGSAFREYIDFYRGSLVIIIGPGRSKFVHTDPKAFDVDFGAPDHWVNVADKEIGDTKDFIVIYEKKKIDYTKTCSTRWMRS